jgi:hypothetical protein
MHTLPISLSCFHSYVSESNTPFHDTFQIIKEYTQFMFIFSLFLPVLAVISLQHKFYELDKFQQALTMQNYIKD